MVERSSRLLRVMVDTTVLIAGIVWPRFPYEVLQHALRGDYRLVLSPYVLTQARRNFGQLFPAYVDEFADLLANLLFEEAEDPTPEEVSDNLTLMRDHSDIPVALAAIKARVDYFVSDDKDFTTPNQPIHDKLHVRQSGTFLSEVIGLSHEELDRIKRRNWVDIPESD